MTLLVSYDCYIGCKFIFSGTQKGSGNKGSGRKGCVKWQVLVYPLCLERVIVISKYE